MTKSKSTLRGLLGIALIAVFALLSIGCNFLGQNQAVIEEGAGNAWAQYKLGQIDPSFAGTAAQQAVVTTMGRLEADLVAFASGTLDPGEQGYINGLLTNEKLLVPTNANPEVIDQLTSLANIFQTNIVAGANGTVTPIEAQAQGAAKNAILGIKAAIKYREGKWALTNPNIWTAPPPPPSAFLFAAPRMAVLDMVPVYRFTR